MTILKTVGHYVIASQRFDANTMLLLVMALSCTPIPPDPGYESTCSFHFHGISAQAAPR